MYQVKGVTRMEILKVESLKKYFDVKARFGIAHKTLKAVDGISFSIKENSVFALVGESGCGKSTVARLILKLIPPTSGKIFFKEKGLNELRGDSLKGFRRSVQIIFQDPFASLNPRKTVFSTISEPLKIHKLYDKRDLRNVVISLLNKVGLDRDVLDRYPHEFSGGQRQRICIARALSVSPELIVADEPLSALDVSIQAQILNLLKEIKEQSRLSFLFISHDLNVVRYFSDNIAVMYLGRIVEASATDELFEKPLHPYTEMLLSSTPKIRIKSKRGSQFIDTGDIPSPLDIPQGCPFHPRCPKKFAPCDSIYPELREPSDGAFAGRLVACHLWNPG